MHYHLARSEYKENTAHEVDDNESEHGVNIPDEITELLYLIDKILG
jgi:hypothetical protein